ncbi:unnamed protein product [Hapterophycus canaliculatus]
MADVSAALPSESALRKERQARWDSDVSEGSSREDKEKARKFKQHREAHYNEFKALQEWRNKRSGDEMDEDSDSDCGNEDGTKGDVTEDRRRRRPAAAAAAASVAATATDATGTGDMSVDDDAGDATCSDNKDGEAAGATAAVADR